MESVHAEISDALSAVRMRGERGEPTDIVAIRGVDGKLRIKGVEPGFRDFIPKHLRANVTVIASWTDQISDAEAWLSKVHADVAKLKELIASGKAPAPAAAPCPCCKQPMNGVGCGVDKVRATAYFGGAKRRIRADAKCRDCAAPEGGYHHFGCCVAKCPYCGGQERYCECDNTATKKRKITMAA